LWKTHVAPRACDFGDSALLRRVKRLSSPLVAAEELASRLGDPNLRVADVRWYLGQPGEGRRRYESAHIPGAVFVDLDTDLAAPSGAGRHPLPDPRSFASRIGALGIGDEHDVVVYDDAGGTIAARLWWMLDVLGHPSVALLDGGLPAWEAAGLPRTAEVPSYAPARLTAPGVAWPRTIDREALKERLGSVVLLDARAGPRYRGEVEPVDRVPGHIPSAVSAPTDGNLAGGARFLPAATLRQRFEALAASSASGDVVTSCGSGITACHNALAMRVAGLPDPILYPGSYSDWSASGERVAVGPEPGPPPK
jgi:thiosulfate/3-mercaptopyruvate sulfurtransferase